MSLTIDQYRAAAKSIGCSVAAIIAVDTVESGGKGFLPDGKPTILFEPHIFWKELRSRGIDPNKHTKGNEDILYPVWGSKPYGKSSQQHVRLERAVKVHREAALESASWGRYQICGFNHKLVGSPTVQDFINRVYKGEAEHLNMFVQYIKSVRLDDELRNLDWRGFAASFNGPLYFKNSYDTKLKKAYEKAKGSN